MQKREHVQINSHIEKAPWTSLANAEQLEACLPSDTVACYELAIKSKFSNFICPVYVGATKDIASRIAGDHAALESHISTEIATALSNNFQLYVRYVSTFENQGSTAYHAFKLERRLLKTCDYAWNIKDNDKTRRRMVGGKYNDYYQASLQYSAKTMKSTSGKVTKTQAVQLPMVELEQLSHEEMQEVYNERREQDNDYNALCAQHEASGSDDDDDGSDDDNNVGFANTLTYNSASTVIFGQQSGYHDEEDDDDNDSDGSDDEEDDDDTSQRRRGYNNYQYNRYNRYQRQRQPYYKKRYY